MELKNAIAVCLISLVSASLVVMIARALDTSAAAQLEPRLAQIVDELQALRKQTRLTASGGSAASGEQTPTSVAATSGGSAPTVTPTADDPLFVYYFHSNTRCPTCQSIESQSHEAVKKYFANALADGRMQWKILNYEKPEGERFKKKFEIEMPVVVLVQMKDGEIHTWKRLDEVWALYDEKPKLGEYVRREIEGMLAPAKAAPKSSAASTNALPLPATPNLPLPVAEKGLPLPATGRPAPK